MKISVVVPSFNHGPFLEQCLLSIFEQSTPNIALDVIVMDGGSLDQSVDIIRKYEQRLAFWVSQPDGGQTAALVEGFRRSSGDVMCWLNSDDFFLGGALAKVADEFVTNPEAGVVYGDAIWVERDGTEIKLQKEIEFDEKILLWVYNYIPQPSTFWRRDLWERSDKLDPRLVCAMDYDLWLKFLRAGGSFRHISAPLSAMRRYPEQKNQRLRAISNREDTLIREQHLGRRCSAVEASILGIWHRGRRISRRLAGGGYSNAGRSGRV